jgi:predicted DNA-binding protein (MmcQ/YjbR family)
MDIEAFVHYCLSKKAATENFPFDKDTLVMKVGGKMFALSSLSDWEKGTPSVNLKCDPDKAAELRALYDDIVPGYHMSKIHWNTVMINRGVPDIMLKQMIDDSYELVYKSLTKKLQGEIG